MKNWERPEVVELSISATEEITNKYGTWEQDPSGRWYLVTKTQS